MWTHCGMCHFIYFTFFCGISNVSLETSTKERQKVLEIDIRLRTLFCKKNRTLSISRSISRSLKFQKFKVEGVSKNIKSLLPFLHALMIFYVVQWTLDFRNISTCKFTYIRYFLEDQFLDSIHKSFLNDSI